MDNHSEILLDQGCSCGCRFCTRSEGRMGRHLDAVLADPDSLPAGNSVTIMAGDLVHPGIVPLIRLLRDRGCGEISLYVHPAISDVMPLKAMQEAGLTGIHLVLPGATRQALEHMCRGPAGLENAAAIINAANWLKLGVYVEIPVVADRFETLPDTVNRAMKMIRFPKGLSLPFRSTHDGQGAAGWDFSTAGEPLARAVRAAAGFGIRARIGGFEGVAPCAIDIENVDVDSYPELDAPVTGGANRCLPACNECFVAPVCRIGMAAFAGSPDSVRPLRSPDSRSKPDEKSPTTSAELFIRKTGLESLLVRARGIDRCPAPWDSLEAHDRTGRTAPCEGSWPKPEVIGAPDDTGGWMINGLLESFNSPFMKSMRHAMVECGRDYSCRRECPRFDETWAKRPPVRLPRTRVFHENLIRNLSEFVEGAEVLDSKPLNITFSPTLRCNQRCRMCDITDPEAGPVGIDTPPAVFDELELLLPTTATLALTGGEPLLSKRIIETVARITPATLPDTRVTITTNGTLLSDEVIARLAHSNLASIMISLNAATAGTHELVTGIRGRFDRVVNNILAMKAAAARMPLKPSVVASFVVMKSNIDELSLFLDLAMRLGVAVRLLPIERNRENESLFSDPDVLIRAESTVRTARTRHPALPERAAAELEQVHRIIRMKLTEITNAAR